MGEGYKKARIISISAIILPASIWIIITKKIPT
jgi:hypothetical protein